MRYFYEKNYLLLKLPKGPFVNVYLISGDI